MTRSRFTVAIIVSLAAFVGVSAQSRKTAPSGEWPTYGHDPGAQRFSPLTQLTPANAGQLQVAWVYHMRPPVVPPPAGAAAAVVAPPQQGRGRGRGSGFAPSGTTPIVIDGVMYLSSPYGRVVALDSTVGKEMWVYQVPSGVASTRGVEYWPGDAKTPAQIVFGTHDGRLISLHAKTGQPNEAFGEHGIVNLNTPEILQGLPGSNGLGSPPIMYKNLIITGGRTQENPPRGPAGDVRAWDVHTGQLVWTFRSIPRAGEKYNDTWAGDSWKNRTGVNVWGFLTVDVKRGIVYMPFGAPSVDQYGG
ncbi:MAG: PQQ-binding-like beta-propeller repeat protein, partial [Acidobacteriota bacterium]